METVLCTLFVLTLHSPHVQHGVHLSACAADHAQDMRFACRTRFARTPINVVLLLLLQRVTVCTEAHSILGCAVVGARSHHMNVLKIGEQLVNQGHNFTMLVSSSDTISLDTVGARGFPGLNVIQFEGPVGEDAPGTEPWAANFSRDLKEARPYICIWWPLCSRCIRIRSYLHFTSKTCSNVVTEL